ncbi:MAG TPA: DUF2889 domain-containing protein [Acidimicrobiales bacterium]|nr:DUF2889 domain-containing protein [Acidimicrobiales bacterium]
MGETMDHIRALHPRHGPHRPHVGTPARRPGSIRRTTTHTSLRPSGLLGDVQLEAAGRDLWTGADGVPSVVAEAGMEATVAFGPNRALTAIRTDPPAGPALDSLVGARVSSGFRKALDRALPDEDRARSLRYQLLDELPTAVLVSGFALAAADVHPPRGTFDLRHNADICAGWATGATILVEGEALGHVPQVTGPVAPPLFDPADTTDPSRPSDPAAWHPVGPIGPHGMRRWRRIDVWRPEGTDGVAVEAFFRDSHVDAAGLETVVHEYLVTAELVPRTHVFRSCRADVGVLPWTECPGALASAGRLEGTTPDDLRSRIREAFTGTSTCTHLNDTLRALAALPFMAGLVEAGGPVG